MALLGNPFVAIVPKQFTHDELTQALRVDIAGEYEAIIGYEAHASAACDDNAKKILYHIADEERRHVGELLELLYRLCPKEQQFIEEGKTELNKHLAN
jgi:rubrerythrin